MATTPHGIYQYTGLETGAPGKDFMNLLGDSVESAFVAVDAQIAAIEEQTDSGWVLITTIPTGWTATPGHPPRVRRVGDRVDLAGAVTRTTTAGPIGNLCTIPEGFRIAGAYLGTTFISTVVQSNGTPTNLTLTGTSHQIGTVYGTLGSGVVVPLVGSWYVN